MYHTLLASHQLMRVQYSVYLVCLMAKLYNRNNSNIPTFPYPLLILKPLFIHQHHQFLIQNMWGHVVFPPINFYLLNCLFVIVRTELDALWKLHWSNRQWVHHYQWGEFLWGASNGLWPSNFDKLLSKCIFTLQEQKLSV